MAQQLLFGLGRTIAWRTRIQRPSFPECIRRSPALVLIPQGLEHGNAACARTHLAQAAIPSTPSAGTDLLTQVHAALDEAHFDAWVETICQAYFVCAEDPGRFTLAASFRVILIAFLEESRHPGNGNLPELQPALPTDLSQIGDLLPCSDRTFSPSGVGRLPLHIHRKVLAHAIGILAHRGLVPAPMASPKSHSEKQSPLLSNLVHKETGEDWASDPGEAAGPKTPLGLYESVRT